MASSSPFSPAAASAAATSSSASKDCVPASECRNSKRIVAEEDNQHDDTEGHDEDNEDEQQIGLQSSGRGSRRFTPPHQHSLTIHNKDVRLKGGRSKLTPRLSKDRMENDEVEEVEEAVDADDKKSMTETENMTESLSSLDPIIPCIVVQQQPVNKELSSVTVASTGTSSVMARNVWNSSSSCNPPPTSSNTNTDITTSTTTNNTENDGGGFTASNVSLSREPIKTNKTLHHSSSPARPKMRSSLRQSTLFGVPKSSINIGNSNNKTVSFMERLTDYLGGSRNSILNNASLSSLNASISLFDDVFDASNSNFNNSGSLSSLMMMPSSSSSSFTTAAAARASRGGSGGNLHLNESFQMSLDCLDEMQAFRKEQGQGSSESLSWANDSGSSFGSLHPIDEHSTRTAAVPIATATTVVNEENKKMKDNHDDEDTVSDSVISEEEHEQCSNANLGVNTSAMGTAECIRHVETASTSTRHQHKHHRRVHTFDETMSYERIRSVIVHCQDSSIKRGTSATTNIDITGNASATSSTSSYIQKSSSDDLWIMVHSNHHGQFQHTDDGATTNTASTTDCSFIPNQTVVMKSRRNLLLGSIEKKHLVFVDDPTNDISLPSCHEKE